MRDFKGMKRQRGRNRGKPGGGGGGGGQNPNRSWESNGPDGVKVRGNAQTVYEKYHQLARDASAAGDRVLAENYLQHAEHYFRVLRALQPNRPVAEIAQRDAFAGGFDLDFEDESGAQAGEGGEPVEYDGVAEGGETEGGDQQSSREERFEREPRRDEGRRDEGRREEGRRDDRREGRRERFESRDRNQDRNQDRDRDRRRDDRERRPRDNGADPLAVIEPSAAPLPSSDEASPVLRAESGEVSDMPAFLRAGAPTETERPRRTRRKRPESFDQGDDTPAPVEEA